MSKTYSINRQVPVIGEYDIIVAGSGPAGICAAVSAARLGRRVLLVERFGIIGGNLTVGHVSPILGSVSAGTMFDELCELFSARHAYAEKAQTRNGIEIHIDHEEAKILLADLIDKAGVGLMLCASVCDVCMYGSRITGLILSTPSGMVCVKGKVIIDATGDGEVAALAGAEIKIGRDDGATQPFSIEFTVDHVVPGALTAWGGSDPVILTGGEYAGKEYRVLCREKEECGELPENVTIVRLHRTFYPDEISVNATQVNGLCPINSEELGHADKLLRAQILPIIDFLRRYVPGYENARLKSSAGMVGVRESRRVVGEYILCDSDVESGAEFNDAVVHRAWFLIDIHNPRGGGQAEGHSHPAKPYDIPYRCFLPLKIDGLLTAGRCISGTHRAHASYRVMAVCMAMGEAVGIAAALSVQNGILPRELSAGEIRSELIRRGVELSD